MTRTPSGAWLARPCVPIRRERLVEPYPARCDCVFAVRRQPTLLVNIDHIEKVDDGALGSARGLHSARLAKAKLMLNWRIRLRASCSIRKVDAMSAKYRLSAHRQTRRLWAERIKVLTQIHDQMVGAAERTLQLVFDDASLVPVPVKAVKDWRRLNRSQSGY